jgi:hypothetical protein
MFRKKKFNHKKKSIADACGIDLDKITKKQKKLNKLIKSGKFDDCLSKEVEAIHNTFNKKELSYMAFQYSYIIQKGGYAEDQGDNKSKSKQGGMYQ